jgi:hypothetical protein
MVLAEVLGWPGTGYRESNGFEEEGALQRVHGQPEDAGLRRI